MTHLVFSFIVESKRLYQDGLEEENERVLQVLTVILASLKQNARVQNQVEQLGEVCGRK